MLIFHLNLNSSVQGPTGEALQHGAETLTVRGILQKAVGMLLVDTEAQLPLEARAWRAQFAHRISDPHTTDLTLDLMDVAVLVPLVTRVHAHPFVLSGFLQTLEEGASVVRTPLSVDHSEN